MKFESNTALESLRFDRGSMCQCGHWVAITGAPEENWSGCLCSCHGSCRDRSTGYVIRRLLSEAETTLDLARYYASLPSMERLTSRERRNLFEARRHAQSANDAMLRISPEKIRRIDFGQMHPTSELS